MANTNPAPETVQVPLGAAQPKPSTATEPTVATAQGNPQTVAEPAAVPSTAATQLAKAPASPVVVPAEDTGPLVSAFASAQSFATAQRMARSLSSSSLVPKAYQGDSGIANCLIAMELANRIGASVFMVMQNLDVIHGRPGWRSTFLIATVNASGRFTPLRYRWVGEEGKDSWGARAFAKDRENGEDCPGALITIAHAKAEGWFQREGSKWKTIPEQMIMYRAAAFWTRVYAPELSLGMQTREEVIDTVGDDVPDTGSPMLATGDTRALEAHLLGKPHITVDGEIIEARKGA